MLVYRELFLGFVKVHILYHASKGEVSGVDMAEELARHGYSLSPGTLYPTLRKLEREGLIKSHPRVERGKRRIYYHATEEGKRALTRAKKQALELVSEIVEEE